MAKTVELSDGTRLEVSNSRARRLIESGEAKLYNPDDAEAEKPKRRSRKESVETTATR